MITKSIVLTATDQNVLLPNLVQLCGAGSLSNQQTSNDSSIFARTQDSYQNFTSKVEINEFLKKMLYEARPAFDDSLKHKLVQEISGLHGSSLEEFLGLNMLKEGDAFFVAASEFLRAYLQEPKRFEKPEQEYERLKTVALRKSNYAFCNCFFPREHSEKGVLTAKIKMALVQTRFIAVSVESEDKSKTLQLSGRYYWSNDKFVAVAYTTTPSTVPNQNQPLQ